VIHDLTHVKGAEAGLQLYMELWENLPIGLVLLHDEEVAGKRDFTILATNRAVLEIIRKEGIEVEDILNLRFFEVFPNLLEKEVADSLRGVTQARTTVSLGEMRLRNERQGETVFSIRAFPLPNRCLGLVFEDITEQAEAKEALRRNEARFRAILESAPDAMVVTDRDGQMVVVNRQTELLFGYRREEMIGEPVEMLMPARFRTGHTAKRAHYAAHAQTRPMGSGMQLYGRRKDGTEFPVDISLSPMETDAGFWLCSAIRESKSEAQNPKSETNSKSESEMTETKGEKLREVKSVKRVKRLGSEGG
jgi:PAS domain S-box-containing protein